MIKPLIRLVAELICINHLVKDLMLSTNYAGVINLDHIFNFSTIRVNHQNMDKLKPAPDVYIINLKEIDTQIFKDLRKTQNRHHHSKYIFLRDASLITSNVASDSTISGSIIIDQTNEHNYNISKGKSGNWKSVNSINGGNCHLNITNDGLPRKLVKNKQDVKMIKICLHLYKPYTFLDASSVLTGIIVDICQMIVEVLNMTSKYILLPIPTQDFSVYQRKILYNGTCDVYPSLGIGHPHETVDISNALFFDSAHWVIKAPGPKPRWKLAFEVFSFHVCIAWLISIVCLSLILLITKRVTCTFRLEEVGEALYEMLRSFCEQSESVKLSKHSLNIIRATIIISSFFMNRFYQTKQIFTLTGNKDSSSISSFEDLMNNNYKIIAHRAIFDFFENDQRVLNYLNKNFEARENIGWDLKGKSASLYMKLLYLSEIRNDLNNDGKPHLKMIKEEVVVLATNAFLRMGDPLKNFIDEKLFMLHENGFISLIMSKYQNLYLEKPIHIHKSLTINSLQLPIAVWVIGIILSLCVFCCEIKR